MTRSSTAYLGRTRPLLYGTSDFLWKSTPPQRFYWDLSRWLVVLPTARGGRRLRTLLSDRANDAQHKFVAPTIITTGELPQRLIGPCSNIAIEIEQTLAWAQALLNTPDNALAALLSRLPSRDSLAPWLDLAATILRLYQDLAAGDLDFGDVQREVSGEGEQRRWQLLSQLHADYLKRLDAAGRVDPFMARKRAIDEHRCGCDQSILLVGTTDLSRSLSRLLQGASENQKAAGVTALVAADEDDRDHFDSFGSIIASRWIQRELSLRDDHLIAAEDVADQAAIAARCVANWRTKFPAAKITIGVTQETLVGPIEFELRSRGIKTYRELGWTIAQTPIGRLLELLAAHLSMSSWRSLAALVRHADMDDFIEHQLAGDLLHRVDGNGKWLQALDNLIGNHFPTRCDDDLPAGVRREDRVAEVVRDRIQQTLHDLRGPARTLSDWAGRLTAWLHVIYPDPTIDESHSQSRGRSAVDATFLFLTAVQELEQSLDVKLSSSAAIEMLMSSLVSLRVFEPAGEDESIISGWLDLALDDAAAMVVTSLNHPYVPEAVTADPFLPGSLRTRLQLNDNERRLARDIQALDVILSTRREVKLVVGTRGLDGSPTPPSRLLAAATPHDAARRLFQMLEPPRRPASDPLASNTNDSVWRFRGTQTRSKLPIPILPQRDPVAVMSVTAFKEYLTCPYRFYLRYVLRIRPLDDAAGELQANQFGDLIHNTLELFGNSDFKDAESPQVIEDALGDMLDTYAGKFFGRSPNAAVRLQIEQARRRLSWLATVQAERRRGGWMIDRVEEPFGGDDDAHIVVDGKPMAIRGRIDRIDRHESKGWAIIDYKSHGHAPRRKHLQVRDGERTWLDLQLPLYQLLIPFVIGKEVRSSDVALSYFNVGSNFNETKINDADFDREEFASALTKIEDCVRGIRGGHFAPSSDVQFDDYSMILQTGAVANLLDQLNHDDDQSPLLAVAEDD